MDIRWKMNVADKKTMDMYSYYISNNVSLRDVGKKFGIGAASVRKRFQKAGLSCKSRNSTRQVKLNENYLRILYLDRKLTMEEIATLTGVSRGTICSKLNELGISRSIEQSKNIRYGRFIWNLESDSRGKELLEHTKSYSTVARILGCSKCAIENRNNKVWKVNLSENSNLFGIPTIAKDGKIYKSSFEAEVADFLIDNGVDYMSQVRVCRERNWTCDFLVYNLWVEVDGLGKFRSRTGGIPYDEQNEKISYYEKNLYKFIILRRNSWKKQLSKALGI